MDEELRKKFTQQLQNIDKYSKPVKKPHAVSSLRKVLLIKLILQLNKTLKTNILDIYYLKGPSNIIQTLDNPLVLEQQLEALEHHKKVLERRGQYQRLGQPDTKDELITHASTNVSNAVKNIGAISKIQSDANKQMPHTHSFSVAHYSNVNENASQSPEKTGGKLQFTHSEYLKIKTNKH